MPFWANFMLSLSQICLYLPSFRREIISKITSFYMYIIYGHYFFLPYLQEIRVLGWHNSYKPQEGVS